jgi:hypothetical protein|tara:strand:+ start:2934 stop:3614 length:681 start_codon:yes stop_codon:yes gene_type:complete
VTDYNRKLSLSTVAIAETQSAVHLLEQKERFESAIQEEDIAVSIDMAKSFLETVFKTILNDRLENPDFPNKFYPLFKMVKDNLAFSTDDFIKEKLENLSGQIVNTTNELRNNYGAASHGNDGYHTNSLQMIDVEFITSSVDGLAAFLYKKHRSTLTPEKNQRIRHGDYPEFDDWLDEQFPSYILPIETGDRPALLLASQIMYIHEEEGYKEMLFQYLNTEAEDNDD